MKEAARGIGVVAAVVGVLFGAPQIASARTLVFAETWENGTDAWRTSNNNGGDCKGFPTCPFSAAMCGPTFPNALKGNTLQIKDGDGEGGRDAKTCSGKYVNIPRAYAGWDAGNYFVTGGATQGGITYKNAQFPVAQGDKICMVAWIRAYDEGGSEAGPYVGINYTGAHGIVDAGHNHCTHFTIGSMDVDPVIYCSWRGGRTGYGAMTQVKKDGNWHRYKSSFTVNASDVQDWRLFSPEFPAGTTWVNDGLVYAQPRLSLFGRPPERADVTATSGAPPIANGADFGDIYVYKTTGAEDPCPTDAELDALPFASEHACGPGMMACKSSVGGVPAGARTPAHPGNQVFKCHGCDASFGAAPGPTTCPEATPFCVGIGPNGGTCTGCSGDEGSTAGDAASRCSAASPTCKADGACGKCTSDDDCATGTHAGPSCNTVTGACIACAADFGSADPNACGQGTPHCDVATHVCGKCGSNADCAGSSAGPICDVATGACGKCDGDKDVSTTAYGCSDPNAPTCDANTGLCGKCSSDKDCVNPAGHRLHARVACDAAGMCSQGDVAPVPLSAGVDPNSLNTGGASGEDAAAEGCAMASGASRGPSGLDLLLGVIGVVLVRRRRRTAHG